MGSMYITVHIMEACNKDYYIIIIIIIITIIIIIIINGFILGRDSFQSY